MSSEGGYISRTSPSGLADVVDVILDKGLVIDAFARVALAGIEVLTVDSRVVIASVDTYLRFAEAASRLDLGSSADAVSPPELAGEIGAQVVEDVAKSKTKGAIQD